MNLARLSMGSTQIQDLTRVLSNSIKYFFSFISRSMSILNGRQNKIFELKVQNGFLTPEKGS